jgi:hypothetical protein
MSGLSAPRAELDRARNLTLRSNCFCLHPRHQRVEIEFARICQAKLLHTGQKAPQGFGYPLVDE